MFEGDFSTYYLTLKEACQRPTGEFTGFSIRATARKIRHLWPPVGLPASSITIVYTELEMAETLGSLCDKLTIVKLKQWHSDDSARLASLAIQEQQLREEIDQFAKMALAGTIPSEKLTFAANKVYKKQGNLAHKASGTIGAIVAQLAAVNCALWHQQEKVYEFESIPVEQKDAVVKQLALLNLERNDCIDGIDRAFKAMVDHRRAGAFAEDR